jgi:zinc protease
MVTVNVWYHVGSKNEKRGRTGFAHLFEHLMFQGSENVGPGMFDKWLESVGGDNNGSTTEDRTNYYENIPSNALEVALFLESDRMANLLGGIDQARLDEQRDVVKNERRQRVDNQPYGRVYETQLEALYPYNHPYSWSVIGSMEDLSAASLEDVGEFFKKYYAPNNASLCIAGDINPEETKKLVEKYFADIPPGPPIDRFTDWIPTLEGIKKIEMKDKVSLARIYMDWPSPALFKQGDAELDMLASILSSGKNSRLYKSLVYEKQIAQDIQVYQSSKEISGSFHVVATAKPGVSLDQLQMEIDAELKKIINNPPSKDELEIAVNAWEAGYIRRLQSTGGKADLLNMYNTYAGRPDYFEENMNRFFSITPESLQKVAQDVIDLENRVIIYVTPEGDLKADESMAIDRTQKPQTGPAPDLTLPAWEERTLSNGLNVLIAEQHELPLIQFNLLVKSGWTADPSGKPGVSSLTSDIQDEGTGNRTALEISQELKSIGASLRTGSSFDGSTVSLNTLKKHTSKSLEIFADVITNPNFPQEDLDRKKEEYLAQILQEKRRPFTAAFKSFLKTLYGDNHPYGQPYTGTGTEESINSITRDDLLTFYNSFFRPNNATLIIVGDVTPDEIIPVLEETFKNWESSDVQAINVPEGRKFEGSHVYLIDKPGAAQSVIVAGRYGIDRSSPDYYSATVMNTILGGKFTSRLNSNLREEKGYTYGARSVFSYRQGQGSFYSYAQVQSEVTKESLVEFMREFNGIAGNIPVKSDELEETKKYITLRYPKEFETISQIGRKLNDLVTYNLPEDYYNSYVSSINGVAQEDVSAAGKKYVRTDNMLFVIVGDLEKIESGIRELNLGEIHYLDSEGNPVKK